jgi:hypothetical protein
MVLAVGALLSVTVTMLWSNANTEAEIAGNTYRISQARHAAHSGMSHFISLHLSDQDIEERLLIPETRLTSKTAYVVEAVWIDDEHLMVMSRGRFKDGSETVFEYPMRAVFTPTLEEEAE